jgi:hypothetical protein
MVNVMSSEMNSNFNEAALQIQRLHESWLKSNRYRTKGDPISYRWELDIIWLELSPDAQRLAGEDLTKNQYYIIYRALEKMICKSISSNNVKSLYFWLGQKHEFLKKIQEKAGKGGSYDDGSRDI